MIAGVGDHHRHRDRATHFGVVTGAAGSTTTGKLRGSSLTTTPYSYV